MPKGKLIVFAFTVIAGLAAFAQSATNAFRPELLFRPHGNFSNNVARPLRYWPVEGAFVITNGTEYFNRPLYCANTAFRVDGGDRPEFSFYLPGRGGNLRIGIRTSAAAKWLNQADQIVARYDGGALRYHVSDPLLRDATLDLNILPLARQKGVILQLRQLAIGTVPATNPVSLIFAFGGANGARGSRGGDIGCERVPVSEFFQLRPEQCRGDGFVVSNRAFLLRHERTIMAGTSPDDMKFSVADAAHWDSLGALLASRGSQTGLPLVIGETEMPPGGTKYFILQQLTEGDAPPALDAASFATAFSLAEEYREGVSRRVTVNTSDPFINNVAAALCVAADAIWDEPQQSYMHGAVAWRTRLLGWRGQYAGDALGWHERTAKHFASFEKQQNTNPVPDNIPPADEQFNLARSEAAIHSNGDMSKNHYDMNLVAVDALFRHLLWTGDTNYARRMWPALERHFSWEKRLFRREFGPDKLPLYEAYAAIWASDDLNYNGAGAAHASAYNYFANTMAARVAKILGHDPAPYQTEAGLILRGMNKYLWLDDEGNFAESKDLLGRQLVHPNSGLWTFYHTMDSEVPSPLQSWRMADWIQYHLAHIPISGPNVPDENLYILPETSWMPYQWSLNNVVVAEAAHTSLGLWQANRPDEAFRLFKGEVLDSMFLGLCPGNVGCMTSHDMARGEAQRDFADGIGVNSRALVEGLFGIHPDAFAGTLRIVPGYPQKWSRAAINHPDLSFSFVAGENHEETYRIQQKFPKPMNLLLQPVARGTPAKITINHQPVSWTWETNIYGFPRIEIHGPAENDLTIAISWTGATPEPRIQNVPAPSAPGAPAFNWAAKIPAATKLVMLNLAPFFNDQVTQIFRNEYRSPRSPYASLATPKRGLGGWCEPNASFDVDDSGLRKTAAANSGKITLPNGISFSTPSETDAKNIIFTSQWDNYPREVSLPLTGKSSHAFLLMAGSTGPIHSRFDNGEIIVTYTDGSTSRLPLYNPTTWWPIDQDYFIDDFAFRHDGPLPPRVDLATGKVRLLDPATFKGQGAKIPGGAATVLELPLDQTKELKSLTVRALANEVVIGLMGVTLER